MSELTDAIRQQELRLAVEREQEGIKSIVEHSQAHIDSGTFGTMKDGKTMTVFSTIVSAKELNDGRETVIPLFWNGKIRSHKEAIDLAIQSNKVWPSATTVDEADFIDKFAHVMMDKSAAR